MLTILAAACAAADISAQTETDAIVFHLASEKLSEASVQLSNGVAVDPASWESLVFATLSVGDQLPVTCTATFVGPRALLTAAHCIDAGEGKKRMARLFVAGATLHLMCDMSDAYKDRPYAGPGELRGPEDYALCELTAPDPAPSVLSRIDGEFIDVEHAWDVNAPVLLTGYGCINMHRDRYGDLWWDFSGDQLNVGTDVIEFQAPDRLTTKARIPVEGRPAAPITPGVEPIICPGDSGGPLFVGPTLDDITAPRRIVGVNSAYDRSPDGALDQMLSHVAPTHAESFVSWARRWARARPSRVICGINETRTTPCRRP